MRAALAALAEAACRLHASLPAALRAENAQLVLELTDRLLNCWAAAATAAAAALPSAQRAELRGAYANAKGRLLGWLLVQAQAQGLREPGGFDAQTGKRMVDSQPTSCCCHGRQQVGSATGEGNIPSTSRRFDTRPPPQRASTCCAGWRAWRRRTAYWRGLSSPAMGGCDTTYAPPPSRAAEGEHLLRRVEGLVEAHRVLAGPLLSRYGWL